MKTSFFNFAAWYCLVVSLATLGVACVIASASGHTNLLPPPSRQFSGALYGCAFWAEVSSFVLGLVSLFGIGRHGVGFIFWKAVPGLLVGGLLGFVFLMLSILSGITC